VIVNPVQYGRYGQSVLSNYIGIGQHAGEALAFAKLDFARHGLRPGGYDGDGGSGRILDFLQSLRGGLGRSGLDDLVNNGRGGGH